MKYAAAHYIFTTKGELLQNALLDTAKSEILDINLSNSHSETAFTVFYNGIICPNYWNLSTESILKLLAEQQKKNPEMTIPKILKQYITKTFSGWIVIEDVDLLNLKFLQTSFVQTI